MFVLVVLVSLSAFSLILFVLLENSRSLTRDWFSLSFSLSNEFYKINK